MTPDERLLYLLTLQQSHDDQIAKLVEQGNLNTEHIAALTKRTMQAMDSINRLAHIAENHENRLEDLEGPHPS